MTALTATADFAALIGSLADKAARLGAARIRGLALARARPDQVWRRPGLIWPLFTTGAE